MDISRFLPFLQNYYGGSRGYEAEQIRRKVPPDPQPGDLKELEGKWGFPRNFKFFLLLIFGEVSKSPSIARWTFGKLKTMKKKSLDVAASRVPSPCLFLKVIIGTNNVTC